MSQFISLQDAIDMTTAYRNNREAILAEEFRDQNIIALNETFDSSAVKQLLDQKDCGKVRIYFGMDGDKKIHVIMVGVNSKDEDMLPDGSNGFEIVENGTRCPEICPPESGLNS